MDSPFRHAPLQRDRPLLDVTGETGLGRASWRLYPDRLVEEHQSILSATRRVVALGPGVRVHASSPSRVGRATLVVMAGPVTLALYVDDGQRAQRFAAMLLSLVDGALPVEPARPLEPHEAAALAELPVEVLHALATSPPLGTTRTGHAGPPRAVELVGVAVHALLSGAMLALVLGLLGAIGAWGPFGDLVALLCLPASFCYLLAFAVVRASEVRVVGDGWRTVIPLGVSIDPRALFEILARAVGRSRSLVYLPCLRGCDAPHRSALSSVCLPRQPASLAARRPA